jgi:hypothetical protein
MSSSSIKIKYIILKITSIFSTPINGNSAKLLASIDVTLWLSLTGNLFIELGIIQFNKKKKKIVILILKYWFG